MGAAAPAKWIDTTAHVVELYETVSNPCGPHAAHRTDKSLWNLDTTSMFQVQKRNADIHGLKRIQPNTEDPDIEVPDFYVFNNGKPRLTQEACNNSTSLEKLPFAFSMHLMADPDHPNKPKTPHGLLLIPVHISGATEPYQAEQFYLLVYGFEKDPRKCTDPYKAQCEALSYLWNKQPSLSVKEMRKQILAKIKIIRPTTEDGDDKAHPDFHNGVIHGNL